MAIDTSQELNKVVSTGDDLYVYNEDDLTTQLLYRTVKNFNDFDGEMSYLRHGLFRSMNILETVNFPEATSCGTSVFLGCENLRSANLPKLTVITGTMFQECVNLEDVNSSACEKVEYSAFWSCYKLNSINLPSCSSIGTAAFYSCKTLSNVEIPNCTFIGSSAFNGCTMLSSINMENVLNIGSSAFISAKFSKLSLPQCLSIGAGAFAQCSLLRALILASSSVAKLMSNAFNFTPMSSSKLFGYYGSIYVPSSLVDAYKTATNWASFSDRITSIDNLPEEV